MVQSEVKAAVESEQPILGTILTTAPEACSCPLPDFFRPLCLPPGHKKIMDGTGTYSEKTDVYSFGLVMWYMLYSRSTTLVCSSLWIFLGRWPRDSDYSLRT